MFSDKEIAIVGENGIGKSTLLRIILGLTEKDSDTIEISENKIKIEF